MNQVAMNQAAEITESTSDEAINEETTTNISHVRSQTVKNSKGVSLLENRAFKRISNIFMIQTGVPDRSTCFLFL